MYGVDLTSLTPCTYCTEVWTNPHSPLGPFYRKFGTAGSFSEFVIGLGWLLMMISILIGWEFTDNKNHNCQIPVIGFLWTVLSERFHFVSFLSLFLAGFWGTVCCSSFQVLCYNGSDLWRFCPSVDVIRGFIVCWDDQCHFGLVLTLFCLRILFVLLLRKLEMIIFLSSYVRISNQMGVNKAKWWLRV